MLSPQGDNRDPRWTPEIDAAIGKKVAQAMAFAPRLELSSDGKTPSPTKDREVLLTTSFREIVKATSIDTLMTAPPPLLEQLSALAVVNNENVKRILVQVIRVYMMLWGTPETNEFARQLLLDMEAAAREKLSQIKDPKPERLRWAPMPC